MIGNLQLHDANPNRQWTEDELALVTTVIDQVAQAAEAIRLINETQERASRERLVGQISDKFRRAPDMESLMKVGLEELSRVLKPQQAFIYMGSETELSAKQDKSTPTVAETISELIQSNVPTDIREIDSAQNGHGDQ
jgi:GAF domain-containing protein